MKNLTPSDLVGFCGSENWYKHMFGMLYTDGIHFVAEQAGAYWLIDVVASYQPKMRKNPGLRDFQLWNVKIDPENPSGCIVTMRDDSGEGSSEFVRQVIEYTDFPLVNFGDEGFGFYVENNVMLLKGEH